MASIHPTIKEAGYKYIKYENGYHYLQLEGSDSIEKWAANKGHASVGLKYKNTDLEFCGSYKEYEDS